LKRFFFLKQCHHFIPVNLNPPFGGLFINLIGFTLTQQNIYIKEKMEMESAEEGNTISIPENIVCVEIFLVTKKLEKIDSGN
jgi:hypothetical protein